jgi:hypothetical protein
MILCSFIVSHETRGLLHEHLHLACALRVAVRCSPGACGIWPRWRVGGTCVNYGGERMHGPLPPPGPPFRWRRQGRTHALPVDTRERSYLSPRACRS